MRWGLDGRVAIVTGGAGGIGEVYCRALAEAGAAVVVADLDETGAQRVAGALASDGHRAAGVRTDITDPGSAGAMADRAREAFGGIDVLVNNAAMMSEIPYDRPLAEYPIDVWERVMRVNLTGALVCTQAVVPAMKERGGGRIINQSSAGAFLGGHVYGVSKLALVGLTVALARELGHLNITVNAIAPGLVADEAGYRSLEKDSPVRTLLHRSIALSGLPEAPPEDLVGALLLLATPAGRWITGQTLNVDGGWVMRL